MNTGDTEKELRDRMAAAGLQRHDPTAAWKQDILRQAREARPHGDGGAPAAPRRLLLALGATWCLILVLRVTTPETGGLPPVTSVAVKAAKSPAAPRPSDDPPLTALSALLAINAQNQPSEIP